MRHAALAAALLLVAPAPAVVADGDVPAEAVVAVLPFEASDEPNRIVVDLGPEGRPLRVMLDTAAADSYFTPLAARAAGITVRALKGTPYRRETRLGRDLQFYVDTRSSDTGARTGWELGLLGGNFLREFVVEIDFAGRTVRLLDPKRYEVPASSGVAGEAVASIRTGARRPIAEIAIGGKPISVLLDTGAPANGILSGKVAAKLGIDVASLGPVADFLTVWGPMPVRRYEAADVEIAGFHFRDVPLFIAPNGWYNMAGEVGDSVIGFDLLSRFLVRIDYPRGRLWLRRTAENVAFYGLDYAPMRSAGALVAPWGRTFYVTDVLPDTPAARLGMRVGDTLLKESTGDAEPRSLAQILAAIAKGDPVRVARRVNDVWIDVDLPDDPLLAPVPESAAD
jgi:predicted aspartyl protease